MTYILIGLIVAAAAAWLVKGWMQPDKGCGACASKNSCATKQQACACSGAAAATSLRENTEKP